MNLPSLPGVPALTDLTSAIVGSARISPTAHYTGYVWVRNGLSHPELASAEGRALYLSLAGTMAFSTVLGGDALEPYLLSRHLAIDRLLEAAIADGRVGTIVEVACGLSPRGWRFASRYGERIDYIEADLPGMAARKRAALERIGSLGPHHRVAEVDVLRGGGAGGPGTLEGLLAELDPARGVAIVTEGLLGYLDTPTVLQLFGRFAQGLRRFPDGRFVSDLHLGDVQTATIRVFRVLLGAFVRGSVHLHFDGASEGEEALVAAGFDDARVVRAADVPGGLARPHGGQLVHIIEASTTLPRGIDHFSAR